MRRRINGEGYIYTRNNRFYIQLRVVDSDGNNRRITIPGGKSAKEANQKLKEYKQKNCLCSGSNQTLGEWLRTWVESYAGHRSDNTNNQYKSLINNHIIPSIGSAKLLELKPTMFANYYRVLSCKCSDNTIRAINNIINGALNQAVKDEIIFRNVLPVVKKPKLKKKMHSILSVKELDQLREEVKKSPYHLPFLLMMYAGLRKSEALGVKWCSMDLKAGTVAVKQQLLEVTRSSGVSLEFCPLKTEKSYRTLVLPENVIEEFKKVSKRNRTGLIYDSNYKNPRRFVAEFKRITKRLGVKSIGLHGLRHTHASHLLRAGVPLSIVSERLGHSSVKVTGDIYSHEVPEMSDASIKAMDKLYRKQGSTAASAGVTA